MPHPTPIDRRPSQGPKTGVVAVLGLLGPALLVNPPASAEPERRPEPGPAVVDFDTHVRAIFERACVECHGPKKASGGLQLTSGTRLRAGGISGPLVVPGNAEKSYLWDRLLGRGDEDRMPLDRPPLSQAELAVIRRWLDGGAVLPPEPPTPFVPAPGGLKRLTVAQYRNTVRDLLGPQVELPTDLEPDTLISGSAVVGAARFGTSRLATERFALAAFGLARQAMADASFRASHVPCAPAPEPPRHLARRARASLDPDCARQLVERLGRRAFRRPLTDGERARYVQVAMASARRAGATRGLEAAVAGLLQSPHFLYRVEVGRPDPEDPRRRLLTGFELASRLSYFLLGGPPDEALLDAAESGRLETEEGLRSEAERLLASPRARTTMQTFFVELLRLKRLDRLTQFRTAYAQASPTLGRAMRTETLRVIEEIAFAPDRDFREIFDARFTYLNAELARLYGLPEPEGGDFIRVALPPNSGRVGILSHGSFLAGNAHPTSSSPSKRGKFIREVLLCQAVPPPPPNVSAKLPEDTDGAVRTTRQKLDVHRTSSQCAGCHKMMDPMGLAFETFDGIGAHRERENGLPIDTSGELDGVPFRDAAGLAGLLRTSPKVGVCVARSLFRFALGHLESEGEEPLMDELGAALEREGYRFTALVMSVVKSRGFRYLSAPEPSSRRCAGCPS